MKQINSIKTYLDIWSFSVHQFRNDFAQFFCIGELSGWREHHIRDWRCDWTGWTRFSCFLWRATETGNLFPKENKNGLSFNWIVPVDVCSDLLAPSTCDGKMHNRKSSIRRFTCSAVFSKFSISKLLVRLVCFPGWITFCGSADEGAGELSTSGENISLPAQILCGINTKCWFCSHNVRRILTPTRRWHNQPGYHFLAHNWRIRRRWWTDQWINHIISYTHDAS